ncbi:isopentenyl-diphosphate Delta-isomerase [Frisingicoccus sp.]|uniref:isopentenyl-diphosphate Delta-isomerase n=1 Tax=Frisingicoccus sp. TaxID=1918627 RepID=UPI00399B0316
MEKQLIWVNENDEVIGYGEKIETHRLGQLHRAFSVFIFDKTSGKMLIQRRALKKYHSGGLWSNACCSHPYKNETWAESFRRCMGEELGIRPDFAENPIEKDAPSDARHIQYVGRFKYYSQYEDLAEHEMDHVFVYYPDKAIKSRIEINEDEVAEIRWISPEELEQWLSQAPADFSTWFAEAYALAKIKI